MPNLSRILLMHYEQLMEELKIKTARMRRNKRKTTDPRFKHIPFFSKPLMKCVQDVDKLSLQNDIFLLAFTLEKLVRQLLLWRHN